MKIFILIVNIFLISKNVYSYKGNGFRAEMNFSEKFYIEGIENNIIILFEDFNVLINLNEKIGDSKITLINKEKKYYISFTKDEIDSLSTFKNIFSKKRSSKNYNLNPIKEHRNIASYEFRGYLCEEKDLKIKAFFSLPLLEYINSCANYKLFLRLVSTTDFSMIPMLEEYYDLIKFFTLQSNEKGLIGILDINGKEIYNINKIESIKESYDEKDLIEKGFKKQGLDYFLSNFM